MRDLLRPDVGLPARQPRRVIVTGSDRLTHRCMRDLLGSDCVVTPQELDTPLIVELAHSRHGEIEQRGEETGKRSRHGSQLVELSNCVRSRTPTNPLSPRPSRTTYGCHPDRGHGGHHDPGWRPAPGPGLQQGPPLDRGADQEGGGRGPLGFLGHLHPDGVREVVRDLPQIHFLSSSSILYYFCTI